VALWVIVFLTVGACALTITLGILFLVDLVVTERRQKWEELRYEQWLRERRQSPLTFFDQDAEEGEEENPQRGY
jgi:hypothetical protein